MKLNICSWLILPLLQFGAFFFFFCFFVWTETYIRNLFPLSEIFQNYFLLTLQLINAFLPLPFMHSKCLAFHFKKTDWWKLAGIAVFRAEAKHSRAQHPTDLTNSVKHLKPFSRTHVDYKARHFKHHLTYHKNETQNEN